jgi:hypothetical protein
MLLSRWRGGESVEELAADYGLANEQITWGLELAALREVLAVLPGKTRTRALMAAHERMGGFRVYKLVGCRKPHREIFDSRWAAWDD